MTPPRALFTDYIFSGSINQQQVSTCVREARLRRTIRICVELGTPDGDGVGISIGGQFSLVDGSSKQNTQRLKVPKPHIMATIYLAGLIQCPEGGGGGE